VHTKFGLNVSLYQLLSAIIIGSLDLPKLILFEPLEGSHKNAGDRGESNYPLSFLKQKLKNIKQWQCDFF
jgi:hypothetical protein